MWEKTYEANPSSRQDAPFAEYDYDEVPQDSPTVDQGDEDYNSDSASDFTQTTNNNRPLSASKSLFSSIPDLNKLVETKKPWEEITDAERVIIISQGGDLVEKIKTRLPCIPDEEKTRPWHLGLISTHLKFASPKPIHLQTLITAASPLPYWLTLKNQSRLDEIGDRHRFNSSMNFSLRFGALVDLNKFYYSPKHSWTSGDWNQLTVNIKASKKGREQIEWIFKDRNVVEIKKELSVQNIDSCVIINLLQNGFDMYICQKCNMSEFDVKQVPEIQQVSDRDEPGRHGRSTAPSTDRPKRFRSAPRSGLLKPPSPMLATQTEKQQPIKFKYQSDRTSQHLGSYFSDVQFSLRYPSSTPNDRFVKKRAKDLTQSALSSLITFFLKQKISVCYGNITELQGADPYLFLRLDRPIFSSLLMNYAWEMLSCVGYRLQLRIDGEFIAQLRRLSEEERNADELFYQTCVYLSRIFLQKPFVNINTELAQAETELRRKRDQSSFGLISSLKSNDENWAYIPAVTITPTTIRVKPLKYCRTNRVLRAKDDRQRLRFGEATECFALVDVCDENGRPLPSYHFRGLRDRLREYLKDGFALMERNRVFRYLHHSQSQLRQRQFWFYYHHDVPDVRARNMTFAEAYAWMGDFSQEKNPAKYAARMALCFSSTRASVEVALDDYYNLS